MLEIQGYLRGSRRSGSLQDSVACWDKLGSTELGACYEVSAGRSGVSREIEGSVTGLGAQRDRC